jgi:hypothetical protein
MNNAPKMIPTLSRYQLALITAHMNHTMAIYRRNAAR